MKEYVLRCHNCKRIFKQNYPPRGSRVLCPLCQAKVKPR